MNKRIKQLLEDFTELLSDLDSVESKKDLEKLVDLEKANLEDVLQEVSRQQAILDETLAATKSAHQNIEDMKAEAEKILKDAKAVAGAEINAARKQAEAMISDADKGVLEASEMVESRKKELEAVKTLVAAEEAKLEKIKKSIQKIASA